MPDVVEVLEDELDEIDGLSEQLAVHQIISEERHNQILTEVDACQNRLDGLSTQLQQLNQTESPQLQMVLSQLTDLRAEVARMMAELSRLKSSLDLIQSSPPPSRLTPTPEPEPVLPSPEDRTEEPEPEEPVAVPPKKVHKYRRL